MFKPTLTKPCPPPPHTAPPPSSHLPHSPSLTFPLSPPKSNLMNFDLFWTDLIQNVTTFCINIFWLQRNYNDQKIQNKTAIFILFINVTTFYSNIFWLVRNPICSSLVKFDPFWIWSKKSKIKWPFLSFL